MKQRGLTLFFTDGTKMHIDYEKQTMNEHGTLMRLKEIIAARQLIVEVDGAMLLFPFENIKYIQAHPAPKKLPDYAILGATMGGAT
jgi:hypothetical protein